MWAEWASNLVLMTFDKACNGRIILEDERTWAKDGSPRCQPLAQASEAMPCSSIAAHGLSLYSSASRVFVREVSAAMAGRWRRMDRIGRFVDVLEPYIASRSGTLSTTRRNHSLAAAARVWQQLCRIQRRATSWCRSVDRSVVTRPVGRPLSAVPCMARTSFAALRSCPRR
jgi:hypothetical protein